MKGKIYALLQKNFKYSLYEHFKCHKIITRNLNHKSGWNLFNEYIV